MSGATLSALLVETRRRVAAAGIADPAQDARLLVGGVLGLTSTMLIAEGGRAVSAQERDAIEAAILRRIAREPVHRILGSRAFINLELQISPDTLEPRPDTEILVERLVPYAQSIVAAKGTCRILDLGTGTGAICLALLDLVPEAEGLGVDVSPGALETARRNADLNGIGGRFRTVESNWFDAIEGCFDIIVSNPPYIPSASMASLEDEVRLFDPPGALDGGADGLDAYRMIAENAGGFLHDPGYLAFEIGFDQKTSVTAIAELQGYRLVEAARDLGGNDRVLIFARSP